MLRYGGLGAVAFPLKIRRFRLLGTVPTRNGPQTRSLGFANKGGFEPTIRANTSGRAPTFAAHEPRSIATSSQTAPRTRIHYRQDRQGMAVQKKSGHRFIRTPIVRFIGGHPGIHDWGGISANLLYGSERFNCNIDLNRTLATTPLTLVGHAADARGLAEGHDAMDGHPSRPQHKGHDSGSRAPSYQ